MSVVTSLKQIHFTANWVNSNAVRNLVVPFYRTLHFSLKLLNVKVENIAVSFQWKIPSKHATPTGDTASWIRANSG